MNTKSDTPETDGLLLELNEGRTYDYDGPRVDLMRKLERERDELRDAIRESDNQFDCINWSYEGDCGAVSVMESLTDLLPENKK